MNCWKWFDCILGLLVADRSGNDGRSYVSTLAISGHDTGKQATFGHDYDISGDKLLTDMEKQILRNTGLC